jgi:uncharacterized protein (TIGR03118 family)
MRARAVSVLAAAVVVLLAGGVRPAAAQFYEQRNLVSDGSVPAALTDSSLVNAWGLVSSPTSPWWVVNNGTDTSTLYNAAGAKVPLTVSVEGGPTGIVFNGTAGAFLVTGLTSRFIFATEEGTIRGWPGTGTVAFVGVDQSASGAIYKGLTIATTESGPRLYATNFSAGTVEVYDATWADVSAGFQDPTLPEGYAPFGIQNINNTIYVTYALRDEEGEDDVAGQGHGFIDAFDTAGNFIRRVASRGVLDSPWGIALAPADFGQFSNMLLVGNFGDGRIHAFDPNALEGNGQYQKRGQLHSAEGKPLEIDGLWALSFGKGAPNNGPANTLFFTAGPDDETGGLFGTLNAAGTPGSN